MQSAMFDYVTPVVLKHHAWSSCQVPLSNLPDTTSFLPSSKARIRKMRMIGRPPAPSSILCILCLSFLLPPLSSGVPAIHSLSLLTGCPQGAKGKERTIVRIRSKYENYSIELQWESLPVLLSQRLPAIMHLSCRAVEWIIHAKLPSTFRSMYRPPAKFLNAMLCCATFFAESLYLL